MSVSLFGKAVVVFSKHNNAYSVTISFPLSLSLSHLMLLYSVGSTLSSFTMKRRLEQWHRELTFLCVCVCGLRQENKGGEVCCDEVTHGRG